jgi:ketosteroid isomerase-like protein
MQQALEPIKGLVKVDRYEMIDPQVYRAGDAAILTYNLVSYGRTTGGVAMAVRWNSTAVYAQIDGQWKIVHSHWSYTKPELKVPGGL